MNTKQFQYILAVAETNNFGEAADKCFITQSTLSTMIGRFEEEIGVKIFDRKTKPVTLTREGEVILNQIKTIQKEIDLLGEKVQNIKGEWIGELKIGVIPTVAPYLLPEFLNDFTRKYPKIRFDISEMTTERILDLLEKREIDIGILAVPLDHKNLVEIPLYNESFILYDCTNSKRDKYVNLDSIDYEKFFILAEGHCLNTQVTNLCDLNQKKNEGFNFNFKAGSIESLVRFVKINKGITLLPYLACLDFPQKDQKYLHYFQNPVPVRTVGIAVHRHFVKQQLLSVLQEDIKRKIVPLLETSEQELVVSPM